MHENMRMYIHLFIHLSIRSLINLYAFSFMHFYAWLQFKYMIAHVFNKVKFWTQIISNSDGKEAKKSTAITLDREREIRKPIWLFFFSGSRRIVN